MITLRSQDLELVTDEETFLLAQKQNNIVQNSFNLPNVSKLEYKNLP